MSSKDKYKVCKWYQLMSTLKSEDRGQRSNMFYK